MYTFNRIKVNPQLPKRIEKLAVIANNLWWSWNTNFLKLFKEIDIDLWERVGKNPVKSAFYEIKMEIMIKKRIIASATLLLPIAVTLVILSSCKDNFTDHMEAKLEIILVSGN